MEHDSAQPLTVDELFGGLVENTSGGVVVSHTTSMGQRFHTLGHSGTARPLDRHTLFEIGSVTKTSTALLLADMALHREVHLDDPLVKYLPAGAGRNRVSRRITLEDLATHSAGLPRTPMSLKLSAARHKDDPYADYSRRRLENAASRLRPRLAGRFRYSSFGYALLGLALENAAHLPFSQLVVDRVCRPLGLAETLVEPSPADSRLACGFHGRTHAVKWHLGAFTPAGGLHSTSSDMLRFLRFHARSGSTVLADAIQMAKTPRRLVARGRLQVCLGWMRVKTPAGRWVTWHNGATGGFSASVALHEESGAAVVALANCQLGGKLDLATLRMIDDLAKQEATQRKC